MADFVPVRAHACTLVDFGTGQSHVGLRAWPLAFDVGLLSNAFGLLSPV